MMKGGRCCIGMSDEKEKYNQSTICSPSLSSLLPVPPSSNDWRKGQKEKKGRSKIMEWIDGSPITSLLIEKSCQTDTSIKWKKIMRRHHWII